MVSSALSLVVSGVPALLVLTMSTEPSGFFTSQVQPEPKLPTAAVWNCFLNSSNELHFFSIAALSAPEGSPPPPGFMQSQKKVWFHTCAALLKTPPGGAFFTI